LFLHKTELFIIWFLHKTELFIIWFLHNTRLFIICAILSVKIKTYAILYFFTMVKIRKMKVQITIYKTLQRKLNIEQRNVTFATNINEILLIQFEFVMLFYAKMNINFSHIMTRKSLHHQFGSHEHFPYGLTTHIFTCHYSIYISWRYKLPPLSQRIHMLLCLCLSKYLILLKHEALIKRQINGKRTSRPCLAVRYDFA
jgi:hypothetical protein